ncbi:MAG: hypothetical protein KH208_03195 [Desulfovibrio sp.]|uniref:hypothetical protein n=1 Tax=Desulfovibrio sp. TaxID=885 RepID=UPI0025BD98DE|nr:hypothetical protein [Desulfovibrio sp.]MBS6828865.1 hypothetical protein [Desulfovibrio sp.]
MDGNTLLPGRRTLLFFQYGNLLACRTTSEKTETYVIRKTTPPGGGSPQRRQTANALKVLSEWGRYDQNTLYK